MNRPVLALLLGLFLALPLSASDDQRWDGADELDVNPLACAGDASDDGVDDMETMEYDGGSVAFTRMIDMRGNPISLVDAPKLGGIAYYEAVALGQRQAADELGTVSIITDAPAEADIDAQIEIIERHIAAGVDGILFAANDPVAIAPVLRKALSNGIHVIGYDGDSQPDAREWFVNPAAAKGIAKALLDSLVDQRGESARFGIVTSFYSAPNQSRWIAEMQAYAEKCYPELDWLETLEAGEDAERAFKQAQSLIEKHGSELDAILALSSVVTPNSAAAIQESGLCGELAIVGLATPKDVKPYVNSGCMRDMIAWNPIDLGYAAVHVMRAVIDGDFGPGDASVMAGRLGELMVVNGSEVLLGAPFVFNAENINDFDY